METSIILKSETIKRLMEENGVISDQLDLMYFDDEGKLKYIPEVADDTEIDEDDAKVFAQIERIYQGVKKDFENGVRFIPDEFQER